MGRLWHEDGYPTVEPGNPIVKGRQEVPTDVDYRTIEEVRARLQELKAKKDSFDPNVHFSGLSRLGPKYTVAEPLAFIDGPNPDQLKMNFALAYGLGGLTMFTAGVLGNKIVHGRYLKGILSGLMIAPLGALAMGELYKWNIKRQNKRTNVLLHYAILHEKDFPVIGKCVYCPLVIQTSKTLTKTLQSAKSLTRSSSTGCRSVLFTTWAKATGAGDFGSFADLLLQWLSLLSQRKIYCKIIGDY